MARIISVLISVFSVLGLIFIGAAIKNSYIEGYSLFSFENFLGALPLFFGCVALLIIGFLIPWEKFSDREPPEEGSHKKSNHQ